MNLLAVFLAVALVGPKPFDATGFARDYSRETFGWTKAKLRGLEGRYGMLLAAAAEPDVDWFWVGVRLAAGEEVLVKGPGALRFGDVVDLGALLPDAFEAATWTDSARFPLTINVTSDNGHGDLPIRLLVRVPKGTRPVPATVDTSLWKGGVP
jgi:hypothetical protein